MPELSSSHKKIIRAIILSLQREILTPGETYPASTLEDAMDTEKFKDILKEVGLQLSDGVAFHYTKLAIAAVRNGYAKYDEVNVGGVTLQVQLAGAKSNRSYTFSLRGGDTEEEIGDDEIPASDISEERKEEALADQVGQERTGSLGNQGYDSSRMPRKSKNDKPEDRTHIAAHIALITNMRCLAISQPKVSAKQIDDNPDLIGIYRESRAFANIDNLEWAGRKEPPNFVFVGCEVKTEIKNETYLYDAVREARHNTRHFDKGYLIATFKEGTMRRAIELAEEYQLGLIHISDGRPWSSTILYQSPGRVKRNGINQFFSGRTEKYVKATVEQLKRLSESTIEVDRSVMGYALKALTTVQEGVSLLGRLPDSIQMDLSSTGDDDSALKTLADYADVVSGVMWDAYNDNEMSVDEFIESELRDYAAYGQNGSAKHPYVNMQKAGNLIRESLKKMIDQLTQDGKDLTSFKGVFPSQCAK